MLPPKPWPFKAEPIEILEPENLQTVIDLATEKGTYVFFKTNKSRIEIKKMIDASDRKGCEFLKQHPDSKILSVYSKEACDAINAIL